MHIPESCWRRPALNHSAQAFKHLLFPVHAKEKKAEETVTVDPNQASLKAALTFYASFDIDGGGFFYRVLGRQVTQTYNQWTSNSSNHMCIILRKSNELSFRRHRRNGDFTIVFFNGRDHLWEKKAMRGSFIFTWLQQVATTIFKSLNGNDSLTGLKIAIDDVTWFFLRGIKKARMKNNHWLYLIVTLYVWIWKG